MWSARSADHTVLAGKGIDTLATLAYVLTTPGVTPSEAALRDLLDSATPESVSLQALASIRRLMFEAQTLCIAQIKASIETEGETKVELAPAERAQRIAAQKRRLSGFDLKLDRWKMLMLTMHTSPPWWNMITRNGLSFTASSLELKRFRGRSLGKS